MNQIEAQSLELHEALGGKVSVEMKHEVASMHDLSLLYSPGVAAPCLEIKADAQKVYDYTWKGNTVAVISNGTAVLGLGNIGARAGLPVMEGKAMLFKAFADINAVPLCIDAADPEQVIAFCTMIAPTFGGINLEDIKAPECVYIEETLQAKLDIPIFHDDQHGTAIVVLAGLVNACRLTGRSLHDLRIVVNGTGAAGSSIIRMLHASQVKSIKAFNVDGMVNPERRAEYDFVVRELCDYVDGDSQVQTLGEALVGADVFIGVSVADAVSPSMVQSMARDSIIFAMANPNPEISYDAAKAAGARIVGTGRSDYPNQVNNVLAFPGIFKGALEVRATKINEAMKLAAADALAHLVSDAELSDTYILPTVLDKRVVAAVKSAVMAAAIATGVAHGHR